MLHSSRECRGQADAKPNVLIYLTDDLGYGDVGWYGAEEQNAPAIDQLAKEGTKFSRGNQVLQLLPPPALQSQQSGLHDRF